MEDLEETKKQPIETTGEFNGDLLGGETPEQTNLMDRAKNASPSIAKIGAITLITLGVLGGCKYGIEYWASPEQEQRRHNEFLRKAEGNPKYSIIEAEEGKLLEISYSDNAILRYEHDPTWENNIAKTVYADSNGNTVAVFTEKIIIFSGEAGVKSWTGVQPSILREFEGYRDLIDDPHPHESDDVVWTRSSSVTITSVPTEVASYDIDESEE